MANELKTAAQVKAWFQANGIPIKAWAIENGYEPATVYSVLNDGKKCIRGEAHRVAVRLGMKPTPSDFPVVACGIEG